MQKRKRFPFFDAPAPKFLFRKLKTIDSSVVLVRVTPDINVINYVNHAIYLIFFFLALFSMTCVCLELVFSNVLYIIFTFLAHYGWLLLTSTYTGYVLPQRLQINVVVFWAMVGYFSGLLWIAAQARRTLREFRALCKMHTMTEVERKDFSLQRFLHFSSPLWLSSSVNYEPTPEELLTLLREHEQATEGQTRAIAATLNDTEDEEAKDEQEESPAISMFLTITSSVSLSLLVPGHDSMPVKLPEAALSLIGFLATRTRGLWITKEELFRQVYDSGQDSAFGMHRGRTDIKITKIAQKAGFFPQKAEEDKPNPLEENSMPVDPTKSAADGYTSTNGENTPTKTDSQEKISLFKNEIKGRVSSWQLTSDCNVEVFPFMTDFYAKVIEAQAISLSDTPNPLSLEQLRQGCHHIIEEYGDGFLASPMEKDGYVWSWALPLYKYYCEQCLSILAYANQREREHLGSCHTRREKTDAVAHIAQLYGWLAMVGVRLDIKDGGRSSEHDMECCLNYYSNVQQVSAAQATYREYCKLRSRVDPTYELGKALEARAQEVFSSIRKTARSRKNEKGVL